MASAVHEMWMGTFTTPGMAAALLEPTPKGALALHLPAPWGKGGATRWFETDMGVLLEAKPVAPVETTRTPRVRVVTTSGGGGFGKQRMLFAKLSHRTMLFLSRTLKHVQHASVRAVCVAPVAPNPVAHMSVELSLIHI